MADYRAAKLRLFAELLASDGTAVVNAESREGAEIRRIARQRGFRVIRYGLKRGDIRCRHAAPSAAGWDLDLDVRSEEHTSELQSLMRISYAVFCLKQKNTQKLATYTDY